MKFARRVFLVAGIYGLLALVPHYFMERKTSADYPPAITHPEYYYGFIGVGIAWQIAFLIISRDPLRYRLIMIPSILEKLGFGTASIVLAALGRAHVVLTLFAGIDLAFALLFFAAYRGLGAARLKSP